MDFFIFWLVLGFSAPTYCYLAAFQKEQSNCHVLDKSKHRLPASKQGSGKRNFGFSKGRYGTLPSHMATALHWTGTQSLRSQKQLETWAWHPRSLYWHSSISTRACKIGRKQSYRQSVKKGSTGKIRVPPSTVTTTVMKNSKGKRLPIVIILILKK